VDSFWTTNTGTGSGTVLNPWSNNATAWLGGNATVAGTPSGDFTITVSGTQVAAGIRQIQNGAGNFTLQGGELQANSFRADTNTLTINSVIGSYTNVANARVDFSAQPAAGTLLILGGNNTLTNAIGITGASSGGGTVRLNHQNALGLGNSVTWVHNTLLDLNGFSVSNKTLTVNNTRTGFLDNTAATKSVWSGNVELTNGTGSLSAGGTGAEVEISGIISGINGLQTLDNGTLRLSGANTYDGLTSVRNGSTLIVGNASALGSTTSGTTINNAANTTLDLNGFNVGNEAITLVGANSRVVNNNTSSAATVAGSITTTNGQIGGSGNLTASGVLSSATATGLSKIGAGTLTLANTNTYTGTTTINEGVLAITNGSAIANAGAVSLSNNAGAVFAVNSSETIGSLRGGGASGGNVNMASGQTLTVAETGSQTFAGLIIDSGALVKSGAGTMILTGANTFGGGATLSAGTLRVGNDAALGTGAFTISGGVLASDSASARVLTNTIIMGGNVQIGDATGTGALTLSNIDLGTTTRTLTVSNTTTVAGAITNTGGLTKAGVGTLTLSGNNTYSGNTTISAGSIRLNNANALGTGTSVQYTATSGLDLNGFSVSGKTLTSVTSGQTGFLTNSTATKSTWSGNVDLTTGLLRAGGTGAEVEISGVISGSGALSSFDFGTLRVTGDNTYSGGTSVREGSKLIVGHANALGSVSHTNFIGLGATLDLNGFDIGSRTVQLQQNTSRLVNDNTNSAASMSGTVIMQTNRNNAQIGGDGNLTLSGAIATSDGTAGGFTKVGTGALTLGASNNYAGTTTLSAGTLRVGNDNALGTGGLTISNGTVLATADGTARTLTNAITMGGDAQLGDATGTGALTLSNINLGTTARTFTVSNNTTVAGAITNTGGLTKSGTGTLTLAGTNIYSGITAVQQGKLIVSSGGSLASSNTTITNAGSSLIVNGTISGLVTATNGGLVAGSGTVGTLNIFGGGVLDPGNSAGTTTATNGAAWAQGGTYNWEIFSLADDPGTSWDLLDVTGGALNLTNITGAGGFTINLITLQSDNATQGALDGFVPAATYTNWLIARAPTIDGFSANLFNLNSSLFAGATGTFAIEQRAVTGGQGLFLTYNVGGEPIPEPGTWAAALLLTGLAAYMRRRAASRAMRDGILVPECRAGTHPGVVPHGRGRIAVAIHPAAPPCRSPTA
jgi:autotransporter-associated beta strand protein